MNTFTFFVRNVVSKTTKGASADYIFVSINGTEAKQTPFIAYGDNKPVAKAKEMKAVSDFQRTAGNEWSAPFHSALMTFMAMGYNSEFDYVVDDNNNAMTVSR